MTRARICLAIGQVSRELYFSLSTLCEIVHDKLRASTREKSKINACVNVFPGEPAVICTQTQLSREGAGTMDRNRHDRRFRRE